MSRDGIKRTIQERLQDIEIEKEYNPGDVFQIEDAAYRAICGFVHGNLHLATYIVTRAVRIKSQLDSLPPPEYVRIPCVITEEDVKTVLETL